MFENSSFSKDKTTDKENRPKSYERKTTSFQNFKKYRKMVEMLRFQMKSIIRKIYTIIKKKMNLKNPDNYC